MVYTSIALLPHSVKAALPDMVDRHTWLDAFNKAYTKTPSFEKAVDSAYEKMKNSPNLRWFEGWLSTDHIDVQGDVMNQKGLFEALKKHVERGGMDVDLHSNRGVGSMYYVDLRKYDDEHMGIWGKGVVYQNEPSFNVVWNEIQKGQKNGFSIGGFAVEWKQTCNHNGCFREIMKPSIQEVSHCTNPADPHANMMMYNELAKSAELDEKHLAKDKQILTQIKSLVEQMLEDDAQERVSPQSNPNMLANPEGEEPKLNGVKVKGVKPIPNMLASPEGDTLPKTVSACGCGKPVKEIRKIGTKQGVCRGHQSKGHQLSSQCQGFGFKDKPTMGKENKIVIDDEFMEGKKPWKPQISVDEHDKMQELNTPVNISEVNNRMASKYIGAFENAMATEKDPRVALAYNKAIKILSEPSGMPVTKRLMAIKSIGCPRCNSVIDSVGINNFRLAGA